MCFEQIETFFEKKWRQLVECNIFSLETFLPSLRRAEHFKYKFLKFHGFLNEMNLYLIKDYKFPMADIFKKFLLYVWATNKGKLSYLKMVVE